MQHVQADVDAHGPTSPSEALTQADARDRQADARDRQADARDRQADAREDALDLRELAIEQAAFLRDARIAELVNEVEGLHAAMEHRSVIEQAKGVIMHTMRCGPDAAFAVLVAQSQAQNRKLRDIAEELASAQDGHVGSQPQAT